MLFGRANSMHIKPWFGGLTLLLAAMSRLKHPYSKAEEDIKFIYGGLGYRFPVPGKISQEPLQFSFFATVLDNIPCVSIPAISWLRASSSRTQMRRSLFAPFISNETFRFLFKSPFVTPGTAVPWRMPSFAYYLTYVHEVVPLRPPL